MRKFSHGHVHHRCDGFPTFGKTLDMKKKNLVSLSVAAIFGVLGTTGLLL